MTASTIEMPHPLRGARNRTEDANTQVAQGIENLLAMIKGLMHTERTVHDIVHGCSAGGGNSFGARASAVLMMNGSTTSGTRSVI